MTMDRLRQGAMLAVLLSTVLSAVAPTSATANPARTARVTTARTSRSRRRRGIAGSSWEIAPQGKQAPPQPPCPAGVPVQPLTVVNKAHDSTYGIARVERAVVLESMRLRGWWGTPCVQFRSGGWPIVLQRRPLDVGGEGVHYADPIRIQVWVGDRPWQMWSQPLSHEVMEALVAYSSPYAGAGYIIGGSSYQIEVSDPVDRKALSVAGVWVANFVTPNWYAGVQRGPCGVDSNGNETCGPLIGQGGNPGPYDAAGTLTAPWQTDSTCEWSDRVTSDC